MSTIGATLGTKYVLRRELGRGGMGLVFAAENTWTGRLVAIKVLRSEYTQDVALIERFWQEARCASLLRHPHIVDVLDLGVDDATGAPFIVQELLDGFGFERLLAESHCERLSPVHALRLLLPVMDALTACHEAGILHRDVKPSNVLLARQPGGELVPKLIDFGISKALLAASSAHTRTGTALGTPQYMAPELARCERDIDARIDVWAMGVTLFETLAGRLPFEGPSVHVIVAQVLHARAPSLRDVAPDVPADLAACIDRALEPDRDRRYPTMRDFAEALRACDASTAPEPHAFLLPPVERAPLETARAAASELSTLSDVTAAPLEEPRAPEASPSEPKLHLPPAPRLRWAAFAAFVIVITCGLAMTQRRAPAPQPRGAEASPRRAAPAPALAEPAPPAIAPDPPAGATVSARAEVPAPRARITPRVAPRRAPTPDPLAPDETPYAQIRQRASRP